MKKIVCMMAFVLMIVVSNRVEAADKYEVKLSWDSKVFDGRVSTPEVESVKVNGHKVKEYTVLYPYEFKDGFEYHEEDSVWHTNSNTGKSYERKKGVCSAGSYKIKVVVSGKTISKTFKIKRKSLKGMFRLSATKWIYNGKTIKPDFVWKATSKDLWKQIANYGIAGQYRPIETTDAKSEDELDLVYNSGESGGIKLFGKVTYPKKSKKCGKYKIVLKGKGNYAGTVTFKYSIVKWKTVEKYRGKTTKHLKSKEAFEKAVKKFCSYSCFRDGAYWDLFTHGGCDGFARYLEKFLGYSDAYQPLNRKLKNVRVGDQLYTQAHACWVIGIDGDKIWTIGGNECKHVSVDYTPKSTYKKIFSSSRHNVRK